MTIIGKFSNGKRTAKVARVLNKKGKVRFVALNSDNKLLINKLFVRMYDAEDIVTQYLHAERKLKIA